MQAGVRVLCDSWIDGWEDRLGCEGTGRRGMVERERVDWLAGRGSD